MSIDETIKTESVVEEQETVENNDVGSYVKFAKPYRFEDDVYDGVDLSGINNLTARDIESIERSYHKLGITSFNPENTASYAKIVAQKATGLPVEFFDQLPIKEMFKIKSRVVNFLYT